MFKKLLSDIQNDIIKFSKQGFPYGIVSAIMDLNNPPINRDISVGNYTLTKESAIDPNSARNIQVFADVSWRQRVYSIDENEKADFRIRINTKNRLLAQRTISPLYLLSKTDIRFEAGAMRMSDHGRASINAALPMFRRRFAEQLCSFIERNIGHFPNDEKVKSVTISNHPDEPIDFSAIQQIRYFVNEVFENISNPVIIGGRNFEAMRNLALHQNEVNPNIYSEPMFAERDCKSPNVSYKSAIAINPQILKYYSFATFANIPATDPYHSPEVVEDLFKAISLMGCNQDEIRGCFYDPLLRSWVNLHLQHDKYRGDWTFCWFLDWDIFIIPPVLDPEVNGIFHFETKRKQSA